MADRLLLTGLGALGLAAWVGWLDYLLLPILGGFLLLLVALVRRARTGRHA